MCDMSHNDALECVVVTMTLSDPSSQICNAPVVRKVFGKFTNDVTSIEHEPSYFPCTLLGESVAHIHCVGADMHLLAMKRCDRVWNAVGMYQTLALIKARSSSTILFREMSLSYCSNIAIGRS